MKSSLLMIGLLGFGVLVTSPEADAQVPTRDTTQAVSGSEPAPADTNPASPDTAAAASDTGAVADTAARGDTTAASDTTETRDTASTRDTTEASDTAPPTRDTTQARDTAAAAASVEPTDSILSAACAGGGTVARDLLVIVFAPGASDGERTAAAESVKGKLLGPVSSSEPGAYYLRVPGSGEFGLRAASDELIQLAQVRQVGSRACPPPPQPDKVQQKPS